MNIESRLPEQKIENPHNPKRENRFFLMFALSLFLPPSPSLLSAFTGCIGFIVLSLTKAVESARYLCYGRKARQ